MASSTSGRLLLLSLYYFTCSMQMAKHSNVPKNAEINLANSGGPSRNFTTFSRSPAEQPRKNTLSFRFFFCFCLVLVLVGDERKIATTATQHKNINSNNTKKESRRRKRKEIGSLICSRSSSSTSSSRFHFYLDEKSSYIFVLFGCAPQ